MKSATHHFRFAIHSGPLDAAQAQACDASTSTDSSLHALTLLERTTFELEDSSDRIEERLGIKRAGGCHGLT